LTGGSHTAKPRKESFAGAAGAAVPSSFRETGT
jgi:hypothetical protein